MTMSSRALVCALFVLLATPAQGGAATYRGVGELPLFKFEDQPLTDRTDLRVNVATGNLLVRTLDLSVAGRGLPLQITRTYNNLTHSYDGDIGHGQKLSVGRNVRIALASDGLTATVEGTSGYEAPFRKNADGSWQTPLGFNATLTRATDSTWSLRFHATGERWNFHSDGLLASVRDKNNNAITVNYDSSRYVTSLTDTQARAFTFTYTTARDVATITDPAGRKITYAYANGDLTSVTDTAGNITRYTFAEAGGTGDLVEILDPRGNATKIEYDTSHRVTRIVRVTDTTTLTGPATTFRYATGDTRCATGTTSTVVTDPRGNPTVHCIDGEHRVRSTIDAAGRTQGTEYDSNSNVIRLSDGLSNLTTATYDADSRFQGGKSPTGFSFSYGYSAPSTTRGTDYYLPRSFTSAQGHSTDFTYDASGNLKTTTDRTTQNGTTLNYNANGTVSSVVDGRGKVTSMTYDAKGNLATWTPPAPLGAHTFGYDTISRVTSVRDGKGQTRTYAYDNADRPTKVTYANAATVSYVYDGNGNITSRTDATGTTSYVYDALNRQTRKTLPGGATITYVYDAAGNMTSYTDGGGTVTYTYNNLNLVDSLTEPGGYRTTFGYNVANSRTRTAFPNGVVEDRTYDTAQRIQTIVAKTSAGTTLTSFSYDYRDAAGADRGLRTAVTDKTGDRTAYSYDSHDRLTRAVRTNGTVTERDWRYAYDAGGNRTQEQEVVTGYLRGYTYNDANQVVARNGETYGYDANGNELSNGAGRTLGYDAKDHTTSMQVSGSAAETMRYAGTTQNERVFTDGVYDYTYTNGLLGIGGLSGTDGYTAHTTRDPSGGLVGLRRGSTRSYYLTDGLGSVVQIQGSSGSTEQTHAYDPFGKDEGSSGNVSQPWRFAGQYYDSNGLYKMGVRWYDPRAGRWTQPDPLMSPADLKQGNRYTYAGADPVNQVDADGRILLCLLVRDCREKVAKPAARTAGRVGGFVARKAPPVCYLISSAGSKDRNTWGDDLTDAVQCMFSIPDND